MRPYRYYAILGISRDATLQDIKRSYRRLARSYHPDRNPGEENEYRFKKINQAFEVLSDTDSRLEYDRSPAECPKCWSHEVLQLSDSEWGCRRCGHEFNFSQMKKLYQVFKSTQCSWCRIFYVDPLKCPAKKIQVACDYYERLGSDVRELFLKDERWLGKIIDTISEVQKDGVISKCRHCGAISLNPNKTVCWQCDTQGLGCPNCESLLHYDTSRNVWRCSNSQCGKRFAYRARRPKSETPPPKAICPNCGKELNFDSNLLLWKCSNRNCKRVFTQRDLYEEPGKQKEKQRERPPKQPPKQSNWAGTGSIVVGIGGLFWWGAVLGIIAIILAMLQWKRYHFARRAIAGLVLGITNIILAVVYFMTGLMPSVF